MNWLTAWFREATKPDCVKYVEKQQEPQPEPIHGVFWDGKWHLCDIKYHSELIKYKTAEECRAALGSCFYVDRYGFSFDSETREPLEIEVYESNFILAMTWNKGDIRMYKDYVQSPVIELCSYIKCADNKYSVSKDEHQGGKSFLVNGVVVKFFDKGHITVNDSSGFNEYEQTLLWKVLSVRLSEERRLKILTDRQKLSDALGVKS